MQYNKIPIVMDQIYLGSSIQKQNNKTNKNKTKQNKTKTKQNTKNKNKQKKINKNKTKNQNLYFEKTKPLSAESFTGYISIPICLRITMMTKCRHFFFQN